MEHRYEERDGKYTLRSWPDDGPEQNAHGPLHCRPEWVLRVLNVAQISGYMSAVTSPPPSKIVWFYTDDNYTLTELKDITNV